MRLSLSLIGLVVRTGGLLAGFEVDLLTNHKRQLMVAWYTLVHCKSRGQSRPAWPAFQDPGFPERAREALTGLQDRTAQEASSTSSLAPTLKRSG